MHPWCLPLDVRSPHGEIVTTLLAIWTVKKPGDGRPSYAAQFARVLDHWAPEIRSAQVVLAGDLNASLQGSSPRGHRRNLDTLHALGARSAYHHHHGVDHGVDEPATLRWIGRGGQPDGFHCDYIFVSEQLLPTVGSATVGPMSVWVDSGRSDHCPVALDLDLADRILVSGLEACIGEHRPGGLTGG